MSLELFNRYNLMYNLVVNIPFFTVLYITGINWHNLRFPVPGYHIDCCGLQSVTKGKSSHTRYHTATYHASTRAGR